MKSLNANPKAICALAALAMIFCFVSPTNLYAMCAQAMSPREYQQRFRRHFDQYTIRPVKNAGETDVVAKGEFYFVTLTHNTSMGITFPTPLLSISDRNGLAFRAYDYAIREILRNEYLDGKRPIPQSLRPEAAKMDAPLQFDTRKTLYTLGHKMVDVNTFVELYDTYPIGDDRPTTSSEQVLNWTHPKRGKENIAILELNRGYVSNKPEVHELDQFMGLMKNVATYIDAFHLSKGREVVLIIRTFDEVRAKDFSIRMGFKRIPEANNESAWIVLEADGAAFAKRFGSGATTMFEQGSFVEHGLADPLYELKKFQTAIRTQEFLLNREYNLERQHNPRFEFSSFSDFISDYFNQQRESSPLVWF